MSNTCSICTHTERDAIDTALVANQPLRNIAEQFGVSATSLHRHRQGHISASIMKSQEAEDVLSADSLLAEVVTLKNRALKIADAAEKRQAWRSALAGIREARACVTLLLKASGELPDNEDVHIMPVNIMLNPQFMQLKALLVSLSQRSPDLRDEITQALLRLEADSLQDQKIQK